MLNDMNFMQMRKKCGENVRFFRQILCVIE